MAKKSKKKSDNCCDGSCIDCCGDGSCDCKSGSMAKKKSKGDCCGDGNFNCESGRCDHDSAGCDCKPEPTGKAPDPVADRLKELEKALGSMSTVVDEFESLLGLCERMEAKSRRIASMGEKLAVWSPLTLLNSSASVAKRNILEELERFAADTARLGAEYRLLKGEQRERENG